MPDLDHPFFSSLVKYIEMELYEQGYKTMICNTVGISRREQEYLDMLERNMVDGIITGSHGLEVEEYRKQAKPIVSIDRDMGPQIPLIGCDHAKGGELAAELRPGITGFCWCSSTCRRRCIFCSLPVFSLRRGFCGRRCSAQVCSPEARLWQSYMGRCCCGYSRKR